MKADALPRATVIHAGASRTRLRVPSRREDLAYFASVASVLSAIRGVQSVKVTPLTGSVLISHNQMLSNLGAEAEKKGLFFLDAGASAIDRAPAPALRVNSQLAVAAALGAVALWQVRQGKYFPSALSLTMHAAALAGLFPTDESSRPRD